MIGRSLPGKTRIGAGRAIAVALALLVGTGAALAEPYPFEGNWVRADRVCAPGAPSLRTYTARDLTMANTRCTLRKVVFGSGEWEVFEDCRRTDRSGSAIERIRMLGPDTMVLKHQTNRLKIPRGRRFVRCNAAAATKPTVAPHLSLPVAPAPKPTPPAPK